MGDYTKTVVNILISFLEVYINPLKIYRGYFRTPCNRTVLHNKFSTRSSGRSSRLVSSLQSITLVISALHYSISLWLGWNVTFPPSRLSWISFFTSLHFEVNIRYNLLEWNHSKCKWKTPFVIWNSFFFKGKYLPTQVSTPSRATTMGLW